MKQVFLSGAGAIEVLDAPLPGRSGGSVLVRNCFSVISSGTEGAAVTRRSGLRGLHEKARNSRDRVDLVWQMAKREGILKTVSTVGHKLQEFLPIGYSSSGIIIETDKEFSGYAIGDRVACMGAGFANHAEYVAVPTNLIARVSESTGLDEAAFASIAGIALQGIRRLDLSPGESVGIIGLGLIGQIAMRLLLAMGYEAFGMDLDASRVQMARLAEGSIVWQSGDLDDAEFVREKTKGRGFDGVVVCAATTSDGPVNLAFDLLRQRGRVSMVGDVGMNLDRAKMYKKELELRLSCSYGPGRYDPAYELDGMDYPLGHVRWTEGRNLTFFLKLLDSKRLSLASLISATVPIAQAKEAYSKLKGGGAYAILLEYTKPQAEENLPPNIIEYPRHQKIKSDRIGLGIVGTGSFARGIHLPNAARLETLFALRGAASRSGGSAASVAKRYKMDVATSDYRLLLENKNIDAVLISTRHASHAKIVLDALEAGKHVFVEKPMVTSVEDGGRIVEKVSQTGLILRVGFNRRFSPMIRALREKIGASGPRMLMVRVNIGRLGDDWSNTPEEGGRFLGEATHFLDLCNWFMGSELKRLSAAFPEASDIRNPNAGVLLQYADGSVAQILYTSFGDVAIGKEYFEAFGSGRSGKLDDYRNLVLAGRLSPSTAARGDKGQLGALTEFGEAIQGRGRDGADAFDGLMATWMAIGARRASITGEVLRPSSRRPAKY